MELSNRFQASFEIFGKKTNGSSYPLKLRLNIITEDMIRFIFMLLVLSSNQYGYLWKKVNVAALQLGQKVITSCTLMSILHGLIPQL